MDGLVRLANIGKQIQKQGSIKPHQLAAMQQFDQDVIAGVPFDQAWPRLNEGWRKDPSPIPPAVAGLTELVLTSTEGFDDLGLRKFLLAIYQEGKRVTPNLIVSSGQPAVQRLIHPKDDYSGSGRAIPEGLYAIGKVERSPTGSWGEGIGPIWIALEPWKGFRANNRSAIGVHVDFNRHDRVTRQPKSPGSIGCVATLTVQDAETVCTWLDKFRPQWLVVDYGKGWLEHCGYQGLGREGSSKMAISDHKSRYIITPVQRAMLDLIAWAEGTDGPNGYKMMFTRKLFSNFASHPRQVQTGGGLSSDAAGRYQFLSTSWDEAAQALKLPDFSINSQDQGAMWLIDVKRRALEEVDSKHLEDALGKLSWEWASLPEPRTGKGRYGQPNKTLNQLQQKYWELLK
jgi:muramidase (phage lysozyme)